MSIELVLTAHPTEVTRRTLIYKLTQIADCLAELEQDLTQVQRAKVELRLTPDNGPSFRTSRPLRRRCRLRTAPADLRVA